MDALRVLDILGFAVGVVYLVLEYRASIWLWVASIVMPAIDMVLYLKAGLYADFAMAIYYCVIALYGFLNWKFSTLSFRRTKTSPTATEQSPTTTETSPTGAALPVSHFPLRLVLPTAAVLAAVWFCIWWFLSRHTNSTVPVTDAFTTALSIVAMWALAHKYAEQWLLWLVVDAICSVLYVYKGIPFKAVIYAVYTLVAVFGYRKWLRMIPAECG